MKVNQIELKKNINFILIASIVLIILFVVCYFVQSDTGKLEEKELNEVGNVEYHKLVINEYMSSSETVVSPDGNSYDWIELYNGTSSDINLKNYGLSDEDDKIKWVFPDVTIEKESYLIIYLSGSKQEGLYAPFKLKSTGGETITLTKPNGKVIDAVQTVGLSKGMSVARDLNGSWIITSKPTPNFINTQEGYEALSSFLTQDVSGLKINEVLPKNSGNFAINNKFYGYVEIMNESNETIELKDCYLSDDMNRLYKYKLKNTSLKPKEVMIIYMGNSYEETNLAFSSFELEKKNGSVYLSNQKGIIDEVTYEDLENGWAYVKRGNEYIKTTIISPGYLNTNEGVEQFYKEHKTLPNTLVISEVMNNNTSYLAQNGYNFYDWIELYNNSSEEINLKEYSLATNTTTQYSLPDVILKPHSYYVVMASGNHELSNKQYTHLDFKVSDSESIYLYKENKIIDSVMISNIPINYSYSRGKEYGFYYNQTPTPNASNKEGTIDISSKPTFSQTAGIYNNVDNITVVLKALGDIYYTLDGSNPTTNSLKYEDGITLDKTSVIRAISVENGKLKSGIVTNSYIINENHTLPVLSMTVPENDYQKLLSNVASDTEVGGYLEFYEEDNSFQIPCSISLFGGSVRWLNKKSYGIRFKKEYGANQLVYHLFDNRDTAVYESIVLRSGSQDYEYAFFRDILGTSLMDDYTDVDVQSYKSAILYINGKYYGIYNIREKVNKDFISNHYNVDPDKLNLIQGNFEIKNGTGDFYTKVTNYIKTHNMSKDESYEEIKNMIDMENFIDFWIGELYTTNNDIVNIRYFSHPDIDNGKMKMIFFDLDWAFYNYGYNYYYFMTRPGGMQEGFYVDDTIMIGLMQNNNFRKDFLTRLSYHLNNTWKTENVLAKYNEIYNMLYPEMERNQIRWNLSFKTWQDEANKVKNYIENRNKYLLQHTKSYFNLSNEEYNRYFGGVA